MIELIPMLPNNVIGFVACGEITANDDETVIILNVESRLKERNKIWIFCHLEPDFCDFSAGAMWDDCRVSLKHLKA
jgi:hypothetical protein